MIDTLEARLRAVLPESAMLTAMLRGIDAFARYRDSLPFARSAYTRTLLHKGDGFELVAMHWAPASVSGIHDHGDARCWVVVLDGVLDVDNYDRLDDGGAVAKLAHAGSMAVRAGDLDHRLNRRELHRVRNEQASSAYSLQIYSPSIEQYTIVNEQTMACTTARALHDFILDL